MKLQGPTKPSKKKFFALLTVWSLASLLVGFVFSLLAPSSLNANKYLVTMQFDKAEISASSNQGGPTDVEYNSVIRLFAESLDGSSIDFASSDSTIMAKVLVASNSDADFIQVFSGKAQSAHRTMWLANFLFTDIRVTEVVHTQKAGELSKGKVWAAGTVIFGFLSVIAFQVFRIVIISSSSNSASMPANNGA